MFWLAFLFAYITLDKQEMLIYGLIMVGGCAVALIINSFEIVVFLILPICAIIIYVMNHSLLAISVILIVLVAIYDEMIK